MTCSELSVYYPQYCFHLSRTIDQWCPLRIVDIHELHASDAHQGTRPPEKSGVFIHMLQTLTRAGCTSL